jgi:hypothetical protein
VDQLIGLTVEEPNVKQVIQLRGKDTVSVPVEKRVEGVPCRCVDPKVPDPVVRLVTIVVTYVHTCRDGPVKRACDDTMSVFDAIVDPHKGVTVCAYAGP